MSRIFDEWQAHQDREFLCSQLLEKYELYAKKLFSNYEPLIISTFDSAPREFFQRLDKWLRNFPDDEKRWEAFQLVDDIFYIGKHEIIELYRVAFEMTVPNWICEVQNLKFRSKKFAEDLGRSVEETWFCPITDSLRISAFRHINHIEQPEYFPDWRSLEAFGDEKSIRKYIEKQKFKQLVLIEDFVGSGKQVTPAIEFAQKVSDIPILVVPLIIGSKGCKKLQELSDNSGGKVKFKPVIVLGDDCVVTKAPVDQEHISSRRARVLIESYSKITGDRNGYGFEVDQGYLFVAEANCPNNTVKPIHSENKWSPLFPRSGRKKLK